MKEFHFFNLQQKKQSIVTSATIDKLRLELNAAMVEASNLKGQLLIMKELTTLTKENAASSMSILYDKLRTASGSSVALDTGA